jgi:hypothetical protein
MNGSDMDPEIHDDELERRLEAYAQARLSPDASASARVRTAVMREAQRRSATAAAADRSASGTVDRVVVPFASRRRRLVPALLAAALALLALAGGALAARPGGPLYETRLAIEELFLPSSGDARAAADLGRLEDRLGELVEAASSGNADAVAAVLAAYRGLVDETAAASGGSDVRDAALEAALAPTSRCSAISRPRSPNRPVSASSKRSSGATGPSRSCTRDPARAVPSRRARPGGGPTNGPPRAVRQTRQDPPGQSSDRPSRAPEDATSRRVPESVLSARFATWADRPRGRAPRTDPVRPARLYLVRDGADAILLDLGQGSFTRVFTEIEPSRLKAVLVSHLTGPLHRPRGVSALPALRVRPAATNDRACRTGRSPSASTRFTLNPASRTRRSTCSRWRQGRGRSAASRSRRNA